MTILVIRKLWKIVYIICMQLLKIHGLFTIVVLLVLIGCEFKVDTYPIPDPPTNIIFLDDTSELVNNFLFLNDSGEKTVKASVSGGGSSLVISWEVLQVDDYVSISGNQGESITINAIKPGEAKIKVMAESADGKIEQILDVLVGNTGSREWMFRILENRPEGITEINDGDEHILLYTEDRIIELIVVGDTGDNEINFNVESTSPIVQIYEVENDTYVISGKARAVAPIKVTVDVGTQSAEKTFSFTLKPYIPMEPLYWDSAVTPSIPLSSSTVYPIKDTPYYFRGTNSNVTKGSGGGFKATGPAGFIIGGGAEIIGLNPGSNASSGTLHPPGELDLSHDAWYRLTIHYTDVYIPSGWIRIQVNNNDQSGGSSPLINAQYRHFTVPGDLLATTAGTDNSYAGSVPGKLVMTINPFRHFSSRNGQTAEGMETLKKAYFAVVTTGVTSITVTAVSLIEFDGDSPPPPP